MTAYAPTPEPRRLPLVEPSGRSTEDPDDDERDERDDCGDKEGIDDEVSALNDLLEVEERGLRWAVALTRADVELSRPETHADAGRGVWTERGTGETAAKVRTGAFTWGTDAIEGTRIGGGGGGRRLTNPTRDLSSSGPNTSPSRQETSQCSQATAKTLYL